MIFKVELLAFQNGDIREVDVPDSKVTGASEDELLEAIFHYGQNDFQPVEGCCSVSVGDLIRLPETGKRFLVSMFGFKEVGPHEEVKQGQVFVGM